MITIELPLDMKDALTKEYCKHFSCTCKVKNGYLYVTTDDPINFLWLGANMNNGFINELLKENNLTNK